MSIFDRFKKDEEKVEDAPVEETQVDETPDDTTPTGDVGGEDEVPAGKVETLPEGKVNKVTVPYTPAPKPDQTFNSDSNVKAEGEKSYL